MGEKKAGRQTACLVVNQIKVNSFAYLFDCSTVGRTENTFRNLNFMTIWCINKVSKILPELAESEPKAHP